MAIREGDAGPQLNSPRGHNDERALTQVDLRERQAQVRSLSFEKLRR